MHFQPEKNTKYVHHTTEKIFSWVHGFNTKSKYASFFLITAALAYVDVESGHNYSNNLFPVWNMLMRMGFYLVVFKLLEAVHLSFQKERTLSQTDFLTGAYNRRFIYDALERQLSLFQRNKRDFVVAYFDLDNFKTVNDTKGHNEGDLVLKTIVSCIHNEQRKHDVLGRMGGDEFILLLPDSTKEQARFALSRLKASLLEEMKKNDWPVTFSIGMAAAKSEHKTPQDLIHAVDAVMYEVKLNGKNSIMMAS